MINKQSIWFLTLFSLILVLSVYYITMPSDLLKTNNSIDTTVALDDIDNERDVKTTISESDVITALRIENDEERDKEIDELNKVLNGSDKSADDKNNAFEKLKDLNSIKGMEQRLEKILKDEFELDAFVKIENDNHIKVVTIKDEHDVDLANKIMKRIQDEYKDRVYISIKFQK